jgi:hypothetical protein
VTVTHRVHIRVRIDPTSNLFGFFKRRHDLCEIKPSPDYLHDITYLLLLIAPQSRYCVVSLRELLADCLNIDSLDEHALHELLTLLELLT